MSETPEPDPPVRVVDKRWWAKTDATGDDGEVRSDKPTYVAELERQLQDKDALLREYAAKYQAASQDFEDARVRMRREVAKDAERETRRVIASFLDVVDNLDRAISAASDAEEISSLVQGVEMVRQQFLTTLDGHGVKPIDAEGKLFDPNLHDAVSMVPITDADREGLVIQVVTPGYRIADEVLRPATVTVGQLDPAPGPQ